MDFAIKKRAMQLTMSMIYDIILLTLALFTEMNNSDTDTKLAAMLYWGTEAEVRNDRSQIFVNPESKPDEIS